MPNTSDAEIEAARAALQRAAAERTFGRKKTSTKADKVRALRPDIVKLRTQGATWADVAEILRPTLGVGPDTIRLAIALPKKIGSKPKASRAIEKTVEPSIRPSQKKKEPNVAPSVSPSEKTRKFGAPDL